MQANLREQSQASMTLSVDAQCGEGVEPPAGYDIPAVARSVFGILVRLGYADDFVVNAGAVAGAGAGAVAGVVKETELCIRLVDAAEGQALNHEWRGKPAPTNVLSFGADIVAGEFAPLGDLVLCAPVVESEAVQQNKPLGDHYSHLLVHGLLHLLGYDHIVESEAQVMEAIEVAVLGELGIDNPYE